ncbi:class I adenylate-forming enzyme family protein [Paraburkholderia caffeinilytica]|uniref:class I adenylate-forming enzyme family protein n=1 Tax=Paraburkholderia caffeinilytica TaxID=1761016 RepID=UPI0038BDB37A
MKMNFARIVGYTALQYANNEALVNIERQRRYTFHELHLLTNRIANMMRERLDLRRGDFYMCLLENDNMSLLHTWTALKGEAGAVYTNFRDSLEEHCWQMDFIKPKVVFIENTLLERYFDLLTQRGITVVCMDPPAAPRDGLHDFWRLVEGSSEANPDVESDTSNDVLIYRFTGGTTGRSKCAQYTIDNWMAMRDASYFENEQYFDEHTRNLHMAPISHASGFSILSTFFRGGCNVTQNLPDLRQWSLNVQTEKITNALLVPTLIYRLLEVKEIAGYDLSSLTTIFYGGSPMSPAKLKLAQDRFGNVFTQIYGATECLQMVGILSKADHLTGVATGRLASAGQVGTGIEVKVVDDNDNEVPQGQTGEIWVRCRGTIAAYFNNPEGTAAEFSNGFWKSGDLGYLDDAGYLFIVDRKKDMIITGGFNVYAVEVEAALSSHPAVENAAVVGVPHVEWGETVHAEVLVRAGSEVSAEELIEHVKGLLGRFKAPKSISFVEALPLSPVGKVLRRHVREKYWKDQARRIG